MAHWLALGFSAWEQPADSTTLCTDEPQELGALRAACAGWSGSFGIATDGRLCGWGRAQLPSIARVQHIACGWDHLVLLRSPASSDCTSELCALSIQQEGCSTLQIITPVATASQSADGQRPRELHCGLSCVLILRENGTVVHGSFLAAPLRPLALPLPVTTMACGKAHWLLVTNDGSVFAQGDNRVGQLGLGHVEPVEEPTLVELLAGVAVVAVACGGQHSLALAGTGDVYSFGSNKHGQLGRDDVDSPAALPALVDLASGMAAGGPDAPTGQPDETVVEIAAGSSHSCAVVASGSAFLWGSGTYGQLGGPFEDCSRPRQLTLPKWYIDGVASGPCSWTTLLRVRARAGAAVSSGGDHADSVSSS
eukprot:m.25929 g.25929  ORF g.25929 m.25929 type:complete len:366 (+) comp4507_c0_seq2:72-1169(+)